MKVYNLHCEHDHRFEGWFASEEDFNKQSQGSQIACPVCGNHKIVKLPSAPGLNLSASAAAPVGVEADEQARGQAQVMHMLRDIVTNTEDVGERFAEEARRMHYNEAPERAIRGITTQDERASLAEEGIDVITLPLPALPKTSLQ